MTIAWQNKLEEAFEAATRLVILGIGNKDRADDAAGVLCAESILQKLENKHPARLKVIIGFEVPENCTHEIRDYHPTHVLILDSVAGGKPPGEIFFVDPSRIVDDDVSTHRIPLPMLLRYLKESIGADVLIIGIQPGDTAPGGPVTPQVLISVDLLGHRIIEMASDADLI